MGWTSLSQLEICPNSTRPTQHFKNFVRTFWSYTLYLGQFNFPSILDVSQAPRTSRSYHEGTRSFILKGYLSYLIAACSRWSRGSQINPTLGFQLHFLYPSSKFSSVMKVDIGMLIEDYLPCMSIGIVLINSNWGENCLASVQWCFVLLTRKVERHENDFVLRLSIIKIHGKATPLVQKQSHPCFHVLKFVQL